MFDSKILYHISEILPELKELDIQIDGQKVHLGEYEKINALLIQNNLLSDQKNNIAIFHPTNDLSDVIILIVMGLTGYKDSIIKNSKLKISDFRTGELVEYEGNVLEFGGVNKDPIDSRESFKLIYGDKYIKLPGGRKIEISYPTSKTHPIEYFTKVSKYKGNKVTADLSGSANASKQFNQILQELLGFQNKHGTSGYPSFLVSSSRSYLVDLLKKVTINHIPFLEMFPSAKCTTSNTYRLGSDTSQKQYMFYFVSDLSTADDILRSEQHIKTILVDAHGKNWKDTSLLASIRNQYNIDNIFLLQTHDKLESIDELEKGLGFKIWMWDKNDFSATEENIQNREEILENKDEYLKLVNAHNNLPKKMTEYADIPVEISYPSEIDSEQHNIVQKQIRKMFSISNDYGTLNLQNFSILSAGMLNKIFQSPLPPSEIDAVNSEIGRQTLKEDFERLENQLTDPLSFSTSEDYKNEAISFLSNIEFLINKFKNYREKCIQTASIIEKHDDKKICVIINPKFSYLLTRFQKDVMNLLETKGKLGTNIDIIFTSSLSQLSNGYEIIIWLFKPPYKQFLMLEPSASKNYLLLYPLQKNEFEKNVLINYYHLQRFLEPEYRSEILKVPQTMLTKGEFKNSDKESELEEPFDIDKLLSTTLISAYHNNQQLKQNDLTKAKMVLFSDNTYAFFQSNFRIRVLDIENKEIEIKTVNQLLEGDDIVFLKNSKKSVFEELVEYYQHKPEIIELIRLSELWRTALIEFRDRHSYHPINIKRLLDNEGYKRHVVTIEGWLEGSTICPPEDNYIAVDLIAKITNNSELLQNSESVKEAAKKMHSLRITIGKYLAKRITKSFISPESFGEDTILKGKLDDISSHVNIEKVTKINQEFTDIPIDMINKLLLGEEI